MQTEIDQDDDEPIITTRKRLRLPSGYPVLAQITIEAAAWFRFERLAENSSEIRIIGHDDPVDGGITIYVGCIDHEVRDRLETGWA